ncbi:unnamed protein product [Clonostachys byssicola]|uniref:Uncharacterized protein n=1 Tax=Clonostachys byssicola TaxID=160290 RepID=A0A9N9U4I8_9HYPO|nr:unnamed protein product [Clonostachys byssicola]
MTGLGENLDGLKVMFGLCAIVHGMAMFYGFTNGPNELFDPLRHLDLRHCTIFFETQFENKAKWNYHNDNLQDIINAFMMIPMQYLYYKVDPKMGNEIWSFSLANAVEPQAPEPEFEMDMLPIELWVPGGDKVQEVLPPKFDY